MCWTVGVERLHHRATGVRKLVLCFVHMCPKELALFLCVGIVAFCFAQGHCLSNQYEDALINASLGFVDFSTDVARSRV